MSLAEYGAYGVYYPVFNLILPFILCGQASAIMMQFFAEKRDNYSPLSADLSQAIFIMSLCFVSYLILLFFGYEIFQIPFLREKKIELLLLISFAAFSEAIKQLFYTLSNCLDDYKVFFWTTNIQAIVFLAVLYFSLSLNGLFTAIIGANILSCLHIYKVLSKNYGLSFRVNFQSKLMKIMFYLGLPSIMSMFLSSAFLYYDRFIIKYFNPQVFSYYVLASSLAVGFGSLGISSVLKAQSIRSLQYLQENKYLDFRKVLRKTEFFLVMLSFLCFGFNYFFGHDLFVLIFGKAFEASFKYIPSLCFSVIILGGAQFYSLILIQMKKFNQLVVLQLSSLILNIILSFVFTKFIRVEFILISFYLTNCFYFVAIYVLSNKNNAQMGLEQKIYFPKYLFVISATFFVTVFKGHFLL